MTKGHEILAKPCFSHVGGKLGQLLMDVFIQKGWISKKRNDDKHFFVTEKGKTQFKKMGLDLSQIKPEEI